MNYINNVKTLGIYKGIEGYQRKIPNNAKRVFKGIKNDIYQWDQKQFDGSSMIFEMIKHKDAAGCIAQNSEGKMIILFENQHSLPPFYSFPGGLIEEGEQPLEAALRELREETGYLATEGDLLTYIQPRLYEEFLIYIFLVRECNSKTEKELEAGENTKILLVEWNKYIELVLSDEFRDKTFQNIIYKMLKDGSINKLKEYFGY